MIDRDPEADDLLALAAGGHSFRLVGPRRYGKTTLLRRVLEAAERAGAATVLVDLQDLFSIAEIVVRIEHGHERVLAHYLWARTARGETADEATWTSALDAASERTAGRTGARDLADAAVRRGDVGCGRDRAHDHPARSTASRRTQR